MRSRVGRRTGKKRSEEREGSMERRGNAILSFILPSLVKKGGEVASGPQPAKVLATSCTSYGTRGAEGKESRTAKVREREKRKGRRAEQQR